MTRTSGPDDDRDAEKPSRPLATTLGLIAMAAVAGVGVAGTLLLLRHGVVAPLQRHAEQAKAGWQRATSSPPDEEEARESPPSETEIAILPLPEQQPDAGNFPSPEDFAKLVDKPSEEEPQVAEDEPSGAPSAKTPEEAPSKLGKEEELAENASTAPTLEEAPPEGRKAASGPDKTPADDLEPEGESAAFGLAMDSEAAGEASRKEAQTRGPDYWVFARQGRQAPVGRNGLMQASWDGIMTAPPAPWTTQPPAPGLTTPPAPWATQPPAPGPTAPPAPWATQPPAPGLTAPPAPWTTQPPAPGLTSPPAPWATQPPAPGLSSPPAPWASQPPAPGLTTPPAPWATQPPAPGLSTPPSGGLFGQPERASDRESRDRR